ncbi:uncharacterized protein LOC133517405 isoform X2 [Cydia pomonella]|nr:uncharacterized protein LOC133517405 isoform X2 [Cydia pomonella]XP_061706717.1 uncharacterized protein LOC133517405 isoform X2 [Cydia pomonella]
MGPPCYGRSDCVNPFTDNGENVTDATTINATPKRYIKINEFKSPIFGSYKYDPLLGDFVLPNNSATPGAAYLVMRAAEDESNLTSEYKLTTIEEKPKNRTKERKNRRRNSNALSQW